MLLKRFLRANKIKVYQLANDLGCTPQHLSNYLTGRGRLSKSLAKLIELHFEGKIKADDLLDQNAICYKERIDEVLKDLM